MSKPFYVINSQGEKELFSSEKVQRSLRRTGVDVPIAKEIANNIKKEAFHGIKTSELFKKVRKSLSKKAPQSALKFSLKEGMRKLGPTGFPFEKYVGEIFKKLGFKVKINQHPPGFCIRSYEIDFIAQKGNLIYIGECKYRNFSGERIHSKDALANYARFLDISKGPFFKAKKYRNSKIKTIMVTNTKFTSQTINYSYCMGVELLGWRCPKNKGLERIIEKQKLYPITILPSLRGPLKEIFVSEKIMLVEDILKINPQKFAQKFKIPIKRFYPLIREAKILLGK